MAHFRRRVAFTAVALFVLIYISTLPRFRRPGVGLSTSVHRPLNSAIDHISRHNGVLPRHWSASHSTMAQDQDLEEVPRNVYKVMGLIFFGRRDTISILDCYLKRNLVKNGGMLDGVIFVERTTDPYDLAFLEELLLSEPQYQRWRVKRPNQSQRKGDYSGAYDRIKDNVMYIKIDDDIVFMEDNVIPSLVHTKASRPDIYVVSANIVNQPLLSWVHSNLGAVRPYLPEMAREFGSFFTSFDWRPSSLPSWSGRASEDINSSAMAPTGGHHNRWLPLRGEDAHLLANKTPIASAEYDPYGPGWRRWQLAAQQHYSFFEHLENNELWQYKFNMWDFKNQRMGIQLVAIMGKDINAAKPIPNDDELHFSTTMPRKLGRLAIADGRGVAAHYSFRTQLKGSNRGGAGGLRSTDILDRYRMFARESVCKGPMLWKSHKDDADLLSKRGPQYAV